MNADAVAFAAIVAAAPPLTLFPFYFAWASRGAWRRNFAGFALMWSTTSLALLVDIVLLYQVFGDDYPFRDLVRNSVYIGIALGAWLKFSALVYYSRKDRKSRA